MMRGVKAYAIACDPPDQQTVADVLARHACVGRVELRGASVGYQIDLDRVPEGELQLVEEVITREVATALSLHRPPSSPPDEVA